MADLNYHHLKQFLAVVREGSVAGAARSLHVTPQTVSEQVRALEDALGTELFERRSRRLLPTDVGLLVAEHAEDVFARGDEILELVRRGDGTRRQSVRVGILEVLPKRIAQHLLEPLFEWDDPPRVVCLQDDPTRLFAALAAHELDVVLSDAPSPAHLAIRAFDHRLGESTVELLAVPALARGRRVTEPETLADLPLLLPRRGSVLRGLFDRWLEDQDLHPPIAAELDDTALANEFAAAGVGALAVPSVIVAELRDRHGLVSLGLVPGLRERFYAVSAERRLHHPAVAALADAARTRFFA